jgi:hypothetical protein
MSGIYTFEYDGFVAVGKPQLLHHAYLYFPPVPGDGENAKVHYASDINRLLLTQIRRRVENGIQVLAIPIEWGNYELTDGDINTYNNPIPSERRDGANNRNSHRYLSKKERENNSHFITYSCEEDRMTWDKVHEESWYNSRMYKANKRALKRALLACPSRDRFSGMTFPQLVAAREKEIKEKNILRAKGINTSQDWYRYQELKGIIRLLGEKLNIAA